MSISTRPLIALALVALTSSLVIAASLNQDNLEETTATITRLREGTKMEEATGWFKRSTDRIEFQPIGDSTKFVVLENLALERIAAELEGEASLVWQIDGSVTEFHGRNYLLVERAFVKSTLDR